MSRPRYSSSTRRSSRGDPRRSSPTNVVRRVLAESPAPALLALTSDNPTAPLGLRPSSCTGRSSDVWCDLVGLPPAGGATNQRQGEHLACNELSVTRSLLDDAHLLCVLHLDLASVRRVRGPVSPQRRFG